MADRHVIYKQCFKEIADSNGLAVTFMAKPHANQSGSSCHIHINLANDSGNSFVGDSNFSGVSKCTDTFKHFLAGCLKYTNESMVFYAPTINAYKRFQAATWAPTRIAWSMDNRTAGYRIVGAGGKGLRIECRIPGADVNPYLAFSALLASGLEGVEKKIMPPEQIKGDIYKHDKVPLVPKTLTEAINIFENSDYAKKVFGEDVVNHYSLYYKKEVELYNSTVTDWERKRYFEQV